MTELREEKATISELRSFIGKNCSQRTLRGWKSAGTVVAVELRDTTTYLVVEDGVRGSREQHIRLDRCRIDDTPAKPTELTEGKVIANKMKRLTNAKMREDYVKPPKIDLNYPGLSGFEK